jgi:oligoendopeptidase F
MEIQTQLPSRKDIHKDSTWSSEAMYANWDAWQAELATAQHALSELKVFAGKLNTGPDVVARWLAYGCQPR